MSLTTDIDLTPLDPILEEYKGGRRSDLLPLLHKAQSALGWLPAEALEAIGQTLRVPLADIHGVVEFYTMFYNEPVGERVVRICTDPSCAVNGGEDLLKAACQQAGVEEGGMTEDGRVTVERMTCLGMCDQAPVALVDEVPMAHVTEDEVGALFENNRPTSELRVVGGPMVLLENIGKVEALDYDAQRMAGRFTALKKALDTLTPETVIDMVKESNLLGRGGAAFPTGLKWQFTRGADATPKYVVCNADESEPGTFKDRVLMEGDPFRVLEGMIIAGYAVGAATGYLFVRGEYPLATQAMQQAIDICYDNGLLGENILGSDFSHDVVLRRGAGAYICGEETALFEAIEGKRGFPRVKPPFPTTHGLFGKPTAINNVETLAMVPSIINKGAAWYTDYGTEDSAGPKLFCVSGHVNTPGVVEVPYGIRLNELINRFCGGFKGTPKTILMGGAAGVFLLPEHFDTPLTYEDLRPLGASIGSGAIMVFNDTVDVRDVLTRLAHFFQHESCGKCYPCQLGTQRQLEVLERVEHGEGQPGDRARLLDIGQTMTDASICGLGQTAGMATLSALDLWPDLVEDEPDKTV